MKGLNGFTGILWRQTVAILIVVFCMSLTTVQAQCPPNIGFEKGSFENWETLAGKIDRDGKINLSLVSPDPTNHRIFSAATNAKETDQYGEFPVVCPNGSGYSVKLGMEAGGSDAFGLYYTFTVPQTNADYSLIYNYAVVLENPTHQPHEQPLFAVKIFNVTDNKYEDCGSFQFIASGNLPGFKLSNGSRPNVFYKDWAPITLKLLNYAGKTLRLEFTVNDCTLGGHFGYAYIDINENCTTPITGNVLCNNVPKLTLTAPYGFMGYRWFTEDFSKELGKSNTLKVSPAPAPGTRLALEIVPYPNQGCLDTLYTTVMKSDDPFDFVLKANMEACETPGLDITAPSLTQGSTPGMVFSYFMDDDESIFVSNPKKIVTPGTYYIKAVNTAGCTDTKPFDALVRKNPVIKVKSELAECIPNTINLTLPAITQGSDPGTIFSYWEDEKATKTFANPSVISKSSTVFLKGTNQYGCTNTQAVYVSVTAPPVLVTRDFTACGQLLFSSVNPIAGSDVSATASYWSDAALTQSISSDYLFTQTTDYYIKLKSVAGCAVSKAAKVTINPIPEFTVTPPASVRIPQTINLANTVPSSTNWTYTYWEDSAATKPLLNPQRIIKSGTYYIKSTNVYACSATYPVQVEIQDALILPSNIFSPNGDGINDTWLIPLIEYYPDSQIEIFTRNGQSVYKSKGYAPVWDGRSNDGRVVPVGVYYYVIKQNAKQKPVSGTVTVIY
ncbi:gliding motility-associated C-terminal domain-containing protein [Sediminibacterium goheungense]|uniref:Gliding motility-associated-like protein n=1 Tax=Sediminibacterium goheungense TaxID=1086393 RepID=A0A4R6IYQ1_9BACT|nr:gliding motility-associated C-terminal domain-containing protein [Sediminibacterium goheungense]TDO27979.1 gliding motility-associated-like protein [Sediminibacterium goheungense]